MNVLLWVVGLIFTGLAIYEFYVFNQAKQGEGTTNMALAVVFAVVACICAFIYFFRKFREEGEQDISITKF